MSRRSIRTLVGVVLWGAALWVAGQAWAADAGTSADAPSTSTKDAATEPLQEVVVTGLRASLGKSLEQKQNAEVVQDSINALELGASRTTMSPTRCGTFPGVSILRTTGGDGLYVAVRGLGQELQHRHAEQPHPGDRR